MKNLLIALLASLTLSITPTYAVDSKPDLSTVAASTVHLLISGTDGEIGRCTGEFISDKLLLTAGHCVEFNSYAYYNVPLPNGKIAALKPIAFSQFGDVAIFKITDDNASKTNITIAPSATLNYNDSLFVYCYNGDDVKPTFVETSFITNDSMMLEGALVFTPEIIVSTDSVHPGCSGGGVYVIDNNNEYILVGTVSGLFDRKDKNNKTTTYATFTTLNSIHNILE